VPVDAAVAVPVHDHVHLRRARGARHGVAAGDGVPREPTYPRLDRLVLVAGQQRLAVEVMEVALDLGLLLVGRQAACLGVGLRPPSRLDVARVLRAHTLEGTDEEPA